MPFTDDACGWVVGELAIALGADPSAVVGTALPDTVAAGADDLPAAEDGASSVIGWGDNDEGEIDVAARLDQVTAVAAGWYHRLALTPPATVVPSLSHPHRLPTPPDGL